MQPWRKGWDSNPRVSCPTAGFQDRCLQPLGHPSTAVTSALSDTATTNVVATRGRHPLAWPRHDFVLATAARMHPRDLPTSSPVSRPACGTNFFCFTPAALADG